MSLRLPMLIAATAAAMFATAAAAVPLPDDANDFLLTFAGPDNGDLDVRLISAAQDATSLTLTAVFGQAVGFTPGAFYVWGINRGQGTARFGALAPGVLFDSLLVINPAGVSSFVDLLNGANTFNLNASQIFVGGTSLSVVVSLASLPSTGFASTGYSFNLWPRVNSVAGITSISDFAPNDSNIFAAVPEPASWALLITGFAGIGTAMRKRRLAVA